MAKNKPTPLKDEPVMSLDDISTKLDNLAASIGALQKEPCEPVVPKVNIQVKGLHFKTEEEFREKVILLYKGLGVYNQEQEDAYIQELHEKGDFSNRELLVTIYNKLFSLSASKKIQATSMNKKVRLLRYWQTFKAIMFKAFYEPNNKWYRNSYAWICVLLTLMFSAFTTYEIINMNRMKTYNAELQTIAVQHQMTRKIVKQLQSELFITINSYDDMVRSKGYSYAYEHFENSKPKEKPGK
ncbi:MAG: hypothetical protein K5882_12555 [Bacteroidales bacterium]|nr:hypothetical protein [Bacteroidales bacterium]